MKFSFLLHNPYHEYRALSCAGTEQPKIQNGHACERARIDERRKIARIAVVWVHGSYKPDFCDKYRRSLECTTLDLP